MECSFCGEELKPGEGKIFITSDGKRLFYCSNKCQKNHRKLGRKARNTEWAQKE